MVAFAVSYLAVLVCRAELPLVGWLIFAAASAVAGVRAWQAKRTHGRPAWFPIILGAMLAITQDPPRPATARPANVTLDADGSVARVEGIVLAGGSVDARGAWFRLDGGVQVRASGLQSIPPAGSTIAVTGRLDATRSVVAVRSPEAIALVLAGPPISAARFFESLRQTCRERIGAACPPATARILLALLIGDSGLPEEFREDLARTGTLHIVAVSGTHLSLFLAGLRIITRRLRVLVPLLVLYAGMCAFDPPVLRSLVLAIGFLCGRRLGRALPEGAHFLLSACVVLALDPAALFDAGFQLSFSAFGGIIALGSPDRSADPFAQARLRDASGRLRAALGPAMRAGAGATLCTAPAMIWRFHRLSPIGIPATILLAPFIPALLWLGACIVVFPDAPAFGRLANAVIELLVLASAAISALPLASVDVARPHAAAVAGLAGVILAIALAPRPHFSGVRIASLSLAAFAVASPDRVPPGFYQLAAGRGAATLLVGSDAAALIDAGPESSRICEQVLGLGVKTIDVVVLTHGHADHAGGLPAVLARLDVRAIAAGPSALPLPTTGGFRTLAWHAGTTFATCGLRLEVLWPPAGFEGAENDRSLVLRADAAGLTALVCGDVESEGLVALLGTHAVAPADVLLVPHHGSANDGLAELLLRVRPRVVVIPARAGVPAEETLRVLGTWGCDVLATFRDGAIALPAKP